MLTVAALVAAAGCRITNWSIGSYVRAAELKNNFTAENLKNQVKQLRGSGRDCKTISTLLSVQFLSDCYIVTRFTRLLGDSFKQGLQLLHRCFEKIRLYFSGCASSKECVNLLLADAKTLLDWLKTTVKTGVEDLVTLTLGAVGASELPPQAALSAIFTFVSGVLSSAWNFITGRVFLAYQTAQEYARNLLSQDVAIYLMYGAFVMEEFSQNRPYED